MKTLDYLSALKAIAPRPTVYAVAQMLDMGEDTVRHWAKGRRFPDDYACARIAQTLGLPIEQVIADVQAESEKDEGRRAYWQGLARKFTTLGLVAICMATGSGNDSPGASGNASVSRGESAELCIMSSAIRLICRVLHDLVVRGFGRFPGLAAS